MFTTIDDWTGVSISAANVDCKSCPAGWYRNDTTYDRCIRCKRGETSKNASSCENCDLGKFGIAHGVCSECSAGIYQDVKGLTGCMECALG